MYQRAVVRDSKDFNYTTIQLSKNRTNERSKIDPSKLNNNANGVNPVITSYSIHYTKLYEKFRKNNIELYLNDFSLDTGIPTIAALAIDRSTFPESSEIVYTAGTTPNAEKALIRAITEVAQLAGDFNSSSNYIASGLPKPLQMEDVQYVTDVKSSTGISEITDLTDNNIRQEVENCIGSLQKLGMETLMINVTHPELQIPALYTIVPGAHFRERSMIV